MNPEERERDGLERLASSLPTHDPPPQLWQRIEEGLRQEQRRAGKGERTQDEKREGLTARLALWFRRPVAKFAMYALLLSIGAGMSWFLIQDYQRRNSMDIAHSANSTDMLTQAQEDIEQAMFYYERAIEKLSLAAVERESELDPEFLALQKAKIAMLRESIDECKTALREQGLHPRVQHYLLAAYNDLQSTLQTMVTETQHERKRSRDS
jgi:hypothetical protein